MSGQPWCLPEAVFRRHSAEAVKKHRPGLANLWETMGDGIMKLIREKLRSQGGAALIFALLFFFLCMMVGASLIAAASSNAGRAKARREKQQEHYTVSCALRMICGRLAKAQYKANALVTETSEEKKPVADSSTWYTFKKTTYAQQNGTVIFDADTAVNTAWNNNLPLQKELDYLFAERFKGGVCIGYHGAGRFRDDNTHTHSTLGGTDVSAPTVHTMILKVDETPAALPSDALPELTKEVEVTIRLSKPGAVGDEKYTIFLEAKLKDSPTFVIKAEMKPAGEFPNVNASATYNGSYPGLSSDRSVFQWELARIYKEIL